MLAFVEDQRDVQRMWQNFEIEDNDVEYRLSSRVKKLEPELEQKRIKITTPEVLNISQRDCYYLRGNVPVEHTSAKFPL